MIRKLRLKFIAVTMGMLVIVFAIVFTMLNLFMQSTSSRQTERFLEMVAESDGMFFFSRDENPRRSGPIDFQPAPSPEMMRAARFFYVKADVDGDYFETNYDMMFDFTKEEALSYADNVLGKSREKGTINNLQYLIVEKGYGRIAVFAERSIEIQMLAQLTEISLWVSGGTCIILLVFSLFLSKWAVSPVKTAFDKQRRFISDASHELKTPLTIITANVDVMENEIGENKRLSSIRSQSERMGALIHDLLTLAKADESGSQIVMAEFDLKKAVLGAALEFESRIFEEGKELSCRITEDIIYVGDESRIKQLVCILVDNAIRYSDFSGKIEVSLERENGRPVLSVFNTGSGVSACESERVFDRFYRSDGSRSRETGGYGLGLSIAKSIAAAHKGRITVSGKPGEWVRFSVYL